MTETANYVSWIESTEEAVKLARNADDARRQSDLLSDANAELGRTLSFFKELRASVAVLQGLDWEGKSVSPDLSRDLEDAIGTLDSRPLHRAQTALDQFGREVESSLKNCWEAHAAQRLGDVGDLLSLSVTLSGVTGITEVSQELSAVLLLLEGSRNLLPNSEAVELLSKAEGLLQELEASLKPDGVRRFLSAVARGGAPVQQLSADVTNWLGKNHALNRFKIVAGPPVEDSGV